MITYQKLLNNRRSPKAWLGCRWLSSANSTLNLKKLMRSVFSFQRQHAQVRKNANARQGEVATFRKCNLQDHLLLTLFWLKAYTTYELLGFFYDLNKTNIEDNLNLILNTLASRASFNFKSPKANQEKLSSVAEIMDVFPGVRLIMDATEQRVERPKNKKDKG